jgi:hypothetical protein
MFEFEDNIGHMFNINSNISENHVDNFFLDLNTIRNIEPNVKLDYIIYYEYLKGLIQLYVLSKKKLKN